MPWKADLQRWLYLGSGTICHLDGLSQWEAPARSDSKERAVSLFIPLVSSVPSCGSGIATFLYLMAVPKSEHLSNGPVHQPQLHCGLLTAPFPAPSRPVVLKASHWCLSQNQSHPEPLQGYWLMSVLFISYQNMDLRLLEFPEPASLHSLPPLHSTLLSTLSGQTFFLCWSWAASLGPVPMVYEAAAAPHKGSRDQGNWV